MTEFTSTKVPESVCPCGESLDKVTSAEGREPKPGDITICAFCARLHRFDEQLVIRFVAEPAKLPEGEGLGRLLQVRQEWQRERQISTMAEQLASWRAKHPRAPLHFRMPPDDAWMVLCLDEMARLLSGTPATRSLLEELRSSQKKRFGYYGDPEPTVNMLRRALKESETPYEQMPLSFFGSYRTALGGKVFPKGGRPS